MAILTTDQVSSIKDTLKEVTDTFFTTPVEYRFIGGSLDRFNEDRKDNAITIYSLKGFVEFTANKLDRTDRMLEGGLDDHKIKVSFNYRDIKEAGLSDGKNETIMNPSKDYMIVNGRKFKVSQVYLDGPIESENVLVIVIGESDENKT